MYCEFLPSGAINSQDYRNQPQELSHALQRERPERDKIYFLHDNAKQHASKNDTPKARLLRWEVFHPPYSPELAPTEFHLFRPLAHFVQGNRYDDREELESDLRHFCESKLTDFYRHGVNFLPER